MEENTPDTLKKIQQPAHMGEGSGNYIRWMADYICRNKEPVRLLICGA